MKKLIAKKYVKVIISLFVIGVLAITLINLYVVIIGSSGFVTLSSAPKAQAVIVPGARMWDNRPSDMLRDRLDMAYNLYIDGIVTKIIVSGDHGTKDYDEPNGMREYLMGRGVPREDIFMDHAGFDTYDTMIRARDVFQVQDAIVVTQKYHLYRSVYIGKKLGIETFGIDATGNIPKKIIYYNIREIASRTKAFLDTQILKSSPKFSGEVIPIWGDGTLTDDGLS